MVTVMQMIPWRPKGDHPDRKHWKAVSAEVHERDKVCRCCGIAKENEYALRLEVHHLPIAYTAEFWGREPAEHLTLLCEECHSAITDVIMRRRDMMLKHKRIPIKETAVVASERIVPISKQANATDVPVMKSARISWSN